MRKKKTVPRTRKHRQASPPQQAGLIAGEKSVPQSAETTCALDNRSHRTVGAKAAAHRIVTNAILPLRHRAARLHALVGQSLIEVHHWLVGNNFGYARRSEPHVSGFKSPVVRCKGTWPSMRIVSERDLVPA
jgi:hypothetical protein